MDCGAITCHFAFSKACLVFCTLVLHLNKTFVDTRCGKLSVQDVVLETLCILSQEVSGDSIQGCSIQRTSCTVLRTPSSKTENTNAVHLGRERSQLPCFSRELRIIVEVKSSLKAVTFQLTLVHFVYFECTKQPRLPETVFKNEIIYLVDPIVFW